MYTSEKIKNGLPTTACSWSPTTTSIRVKSDPYGEKRRAIPPQRRADTGESIQ
jgi:hypothetical protein